MRYGKYKNFTQISLFKRELACFRWNGLGGRRTNEVLQPGTETA
jgi:hypothetical protein